MGGFAWCGEWHTCRSFGNAQGCAKDETRGDRVLQDCGSGLLEHAYCSATTCLPMIMPSLSQSRTWLVGARPTGSAFVKSLSGLVGGRHGTAHSTRPHWADAALLYPSVHRMARALHNPEQRLSKAPLCSPIPFAFWHGCPPWPPDCLLPRLFWFDLLCSSAFLLYSHMYLAWYSGSYIRPGVHPSQGPALGLPGLL